MYVCDLGTKAQDQRLKYAFEYQQLWEDNISGFLLENNYYISLCKLGIGVLGVSNADMIPIEDNIGNNKMIHTFGSVDYLKVEPNNYIFFGF